MSNCFVLVAIKSGFTRFKMISNFVRNKAVHNTTPWLSYASWTWEVLRRNPDYISYFNSLRNKGLLTKNLTKNIVLTTANQRFPTANEFGLLYPANPDLDAGEQPVFWCPKIFKAAVRFHVVEKAQINRKKLPIKLSKCQGHQTHFLDANGTYHIRFLGRDFWFQIYCDNLSKIDPNAYIGLEINHVAERTKKLKTFDEFSDLYDGAIAPNEGLHVPARLLYHQRSIITYDVRTLGGTITDAILAMKQLDLLDKDPDNMQDFTDVAKHSYKRAKAFIYGDYLKILERQ